MRTIRFGILAAAVCVRTTSYAQDAAVAKAESDETKSGTEEKKPDDKAWETAPHEHRGGFVIGLTAAAGLGAANGFPNDATKIGRIAYYTESGLGINSTSGLWLGGALADWLNFGVGFGYSMILNSETRSTTPLIFFHSDVFPFYGLGGPLRDLGGVFEVGLGFPQTVDTETDEVLIAGTSSYLLAGAAWEGIEAWKFRFGPMLAGQYMWSETLRRPALLLGFRGTLYTGP